MQTKLKEIRKSRGFTGEQIAERLGVSQSTISAWETGRTPFSLEQACQLADILRCTLDELAGRKTSIEPQVAKIADEWRSMNSIGQEALEKASQAFAALPDYRKRSDQIQASSVMA